MDSIESRKDYKKTRKGQSQYWEQEITAANKRLEKWHKAGNSIVNKYIYQREKRHAKESNLNLFYSNISLTQAMLFGNLPQPSVYRRYHDANDDVARVASEMSERLLTLDIEENGAEYTAVLRAVLQDRLLPGLGIARCRYEVETEITEQPTTKEVFDPQTQQNLPIQTTEEVENLIHEDAPTEYFHWRDVLWGWSRTWADLPWIAFRTYLTKDEIAERFNKNIANSLEYKQQDLGGSERNENNPDYNENWQKAEIWEIWDKENNEVCFYSQGAQKLLENPSPDPLKLEGFFPTPPFFLANPTTTLLHPTPDYKLSEDQYCEIDILQTRISLITDAVRVVGVYNKEIAELQNMFDGNETTLIPVDNFAMFAEKGGLQGAIDWFPVKEVVDTLVTLTQQRDAQIELLYQINGMSDILRGGGTKERESATAQGLKAKFGSARLQGIQDAFASFVSDLLQLKLEIIAKHFDIQTIIDRSNIMMTEDKDLAQQAAQLIKKPGKMQFRVKVEADSLAMVDFAQKKAERTEFLNAATSYMQAASGMIQADPSSRPYIMKMLQWGMAGFKGAQQIEGVLDKAIKQAEQNPLPQNDQASMQNQKNQIEMQKIQLKIKENIQKHQMDMQKLQAQHQQQIALIEENLRAEITKIQEKMNADVKEEVLQSEVNAEQSALQTSAEMQRDEVSHEHDLELEDTQHENNMREINAQAAKRSTSDE